MRPGRLDRILYVGPPDFAGRVDILRIRTRNMAVDPALDIDALATLVRSRLLPPHRTRDAILSLTVVGFAWNRRAGARAQNLRLCAKRPQ